MCNVCQFPSSLSPLLYLHLVFFSLAGPSEVSTASGESLAKYLTCERAQLRRDSETPNKRLGIGKDTVHYEIPPGNQRTEMPPFAHAVDPTPFNKPLTIIRLPLLLDFNIILLCIFKELANI